MGFFRSKWTNQGNKFGGNDSMVDKLSYFEWLYMILSKLEKKNDFLPAHPKFFDHDFCFSFSTSES